jgi:hypothetical protein
VIACVRCFLRAGGVEGFFREAVTVYGGEALCAEHLGEAATAPSGNLARTSFLDLDGGKTDE